MIRSFKCKETQRIFKREFSKRFASIEKIALRKLLLLEVAGRVEDLKIPPGNKLEKLHGDRIGQFSIRVNDQWRICFRWFEGNVHEVEIVDYH